MKDTVFLERGWSHDVTYLVNTDTGERVALPSNERGKWDLKLSKHNGSVFLQLDGVAKKWVTAYLQHCVWQDDFGVDFLKTLPDGRVTLKQFLRAYTEVIINLRTHSQTCTQMYKHTCLWLHFSTNGANLWWSLLALYNNWGLGSKAEAVARNYHHRWKSWLKLTNKMGLPHIHLRKAAITNHLQDNDPERHSDERLVDFPSVSTHLMVTLLSRWAFLPWGRGGVQDNQIKQGSLKALNAILHVLDGCECLICMSPGATWEPPQRPRSQHFNTFVECNNLVVCFKRPLQAFLRTSWPGLHDVFYQCCPDETGRVPVITVLQKALEIGEHAHQVFQQLIWGLCIHIEEKLVNELQNPKTSDSLGHNEQDDSTGGQGREQNPLYRSDSSMGGQRITPGFSIAAREKELESDHKTHLYLSTYFRSAQELLWGQKIISIAIDGARIAQKSLLLCAVAVPTGEAVWAPPQVGLDYMGEASLAILDGEPDVLEDRKRAWTRSSEAWTEGGAAKPDIKRQRTKAYQWLRGVDNIITMYTGEGLSQYILHNDLAKRPENPMDWPWLGVSLDRGPDSWAAKQYMKYFLKANVEEFPDQSHDNWNDVRASLREVGVWQNVLVMVLALNLSHGPWAEGKWYEKLRRAFFEYHSISNSNDPIFRWMLPWILIDRGQLNRRHEINIAQEVWDSLPDAWCWHQRGDKVGLCRFFGYVHCSVPYQHIFHTKLLAMIYLGKQEGWLNSKKAKDFKRLTVKTVMPTSCEKKQSIKDSNAEVKQLFKFGNTIQLVTMACLDPDTYFIQSMVNTCVPPLVKWHSIQNKKLRSCSGAQEWIMEQASGGFLGPLLEIFETLYDETSLEKAGLTINKDLYPTDKFKQVDLEHPFIDQEQSRAGMILRFCLTLAKNRIGRCFWALRGWPTQSCLLGHKDAKTREKIIKRLQVDYNNYHSSCEASTFFQEQCMSVFETAPVQQIVEIMKRANWIDSPHVQAWFTKKYSSLIQTQLIEDGFQRERLKETCSGRRQFSCNSAWYTVIKKKVIQTVHKFKYVQLVGTKRGKANMVNRRHLFYPHEKKVSCNLKHITDTKKTNNEDWWSCNSSTWNQPFAHLVLQEYCMKNKDQFKHIDNTWLCILFKNLHVLVRLKGTEQWFFALGDVGGILGVGWPAVELRDNLGKTVGYLPQKDRSADLMDLIQYFPLTKVWPPEESEYEAMAYTARSPFAMKLSGHSDIVYEIPTLNTSSQPVASSTAPVAPDPEPPALQKPRGCCLVAIPNTGKAEAILSIAARQCFGQMGIGHCKDLAHHLGVHILPKDKLIDILAKLLRYVLSPLEEEDLLDLLAMREFKKSPLEDILESEEVQEHFDARDFTEVEKDKEDAVVSKKERKEYKYRLSQMRKDFRKNVKDDKKFPCKNRKRYMNPLTKEERSRMPTKVEPGNMPASFVENASPPGCKIYHDLVNGRWMVKLGTYSKSRSWIKYGHTESGVLILAKAWERYMELYGLETCPIKGLIEEAKAIEGKPKKDTEFSSFAKSVLGKAISAHATVAGTGSPKATGASATTV